MHASLLAAILASSVCPANGRVARNEKRRRNGLEDPAGATLIEKYPFYHTSAALADEASTLAKSCSGLTVRSETEGEASLPVARLSTRSSSDKSTTHVLMVFGEHARELISPETGLGFLRWLCSSEASQLRSRTSFELVLNANPRGRNQVESGEYCTRTNENGVDLNRNYGFHWKAEHEDDDERGVGSKEGKPVEAFSSGAGPFSEPETKIIARLLSESKPDVFLDVHSGTKGLFMPYDWTTDPIPNEDDRQNMKKVLQEVNTNDCPECMVGDCAETVGYLAPGSSADFAYSQGVKFSFIWEIYADAADAAEDARDQQAFLSSKKAANSLLQKTRSVKNSRKITFGGDVGASLPQWALDDEAALKPMEAEAKQHCLVQFNPLTEATYSSTVSRWSSAFVTLCNAVQRIRDN
mmetsp:Transcript_69721/g.109057  ORF Transcript_69721/g.109057 Transcript_69721/m.109057 type:complete len:411 (+) Transcript_69721:50-1282(+)